LFSHNPCKKKYTLNNCFGSKKINKAIKTFLIKSEKIKNILIYPEPDDKEDWESGEIPWDPKNTTNYNRKKQSNDTDIMVGDIPVNPLRPLNINDVAMLFV
jgi:S-methylmethionine-dependent homocysteine/selenocysteine methylase